MQASDYPHLTVATVVVRNGQFLMVEEMDSGRSVLNQPAGHVEPGESLLEAAMRETLEETGWEVSITHLLGTSSHTASNGISYQRIAFAAQATKQISATPLDSDITTCCWMNETEIIDQSARMRSPLVLATLQRYTTGQFYPLDFLF